MLSQSKASIQALELDCLTDEATCLLLKAISHQGAAAAGAYRAWRALGTLDDANYTHHRALPQLTIVSQREHIAEPDLPRMQGLARHFWTSNSVKLGHLQQVLDVLRQSDIQPILLSGAALIARDARRIQSFAIDSLEILVPGDAFPTAHQALTSCGYRPEATYFGGHQKRPMAPPLHGAVLFALDDRCKVVIRTSPLTNISDAHFVEQIWSKSVRADLAGREIRVPSVGHQLFCAMAQNSLWNETACFTRLLEGQALLAMFPGEVDWNGVIDLTQRYGMEAFGLAYVHVLATCTPHRIPETVVSTLAESVDQAGINEWHQFRNKSIYGFRWRRFLQVRREFILGRHRGSVLARSFAEAIVRRLGRKPLRA